MSKPNFLEPIGEYNLCRFDSIVGKWSHEPLCLDQLRNPPDKHSVLHLTEKVITLQKDQVVAFVDLWRGIVSYDMLLGTNTASYMPLPLELINLDRTRGALIGRDIAVVKGRLTVVRLASCRDQCLTDAQVVYIMGKVDILDEKAKAVLLSVDMANRRLQEVSMYDTERIINNYGVSYTQSTIFLYFTNASGD
ncbi:hypothetical protein E2562_008824 [Oryza meyeriana var. granulata]|uniref:DUF1618 domain-containing protein n=1 Tax=Oryza meyeriana var. granulata TaxID=110450 RepID=A0A6G1D075_9ORYZ|nr:hypothetical protein E2562_008824 [Oryza meyeriana var. granulata]